MENPTSRHFVKSTYNNNYMSMYVTMQRLVMRNVCSCKWLIFSEQSKTWLRWKGQEFNVRLKLIPSGQWKMCSTPLHNVAKNMLAKLWSKNMDSRDLVRDANSSDSSISKYLTTEPNRCSQSRALNKGFQISIRWETGWSECFSWETRWRRDLPGWTH